MSSTVDSSEALEAKGVTPPRLSPFLTLPPLLTRDLLGLFEKCSTKGDIVRLDLWGFQLHQVNHPELAQEILRDKGKVYRKGRLMRRLKTVTGEGLLINDGDTWLRHRRLANPAFTPSRLDGYTETMLRSAEKLVERWRAYPEDKPIDIIHEMSEITLTSLLRTILGIDFDEDFDGFTEVAHELLGEVVDRNSNLFPLPLSFPTKANIKFKEKVSKANRIIEKMIEHRQRILGNEDKPVDLLGQWLQKAQEDEDAFSPSEMRDELMTMLLAGHHSLAVAMTWTLYEIARHPEVQAKLQHEVDHLESLPTGLKELNKIPYAQGTLLEALRFYPQPPVILREALEAHNVGRFRFKVGDQLLINPMAIHMHPDCWEDPTTFKPERYVDFPLEAMMQHHYLTFGGGSRVCIGRKFSILEGSLLLTRIAKNFHLSPTTDEPIKPLFTKMMGPDKPLTLKVTHRA